MRPSPGSGLFLCHCEWGVVPLEPGNATSGDGPQIEAGYAAIRAVPAAIALELLACDLAVVIDHGHAALYGQVIEAQDVRALEAEEQKHLGRPGADAPQRTEGGYGIRVLHVLHGGKVELAAVDLVGEVLDVAGLLERHAAGLELLDACLVHAGGVDAAKCLLQAGPDGSLRGGGNLLPDDVMDDGREQVLVHLPEHVAACLVNGGDRLAQALVARGEVARGLARVREVAGHLGPPVVSLGTE